MTGPEDEKDRASQRIGGGRGIRYGNVVSGEHTDHARLSLRVERQLFSAESDYQRIDVLESTEFGKVLVVDGDLMLTERTNLSTMK